MAIIETVKSEGKKSTEGLTGHLSFEQDNNRIIGRDNNALPRLLILADGTQFVMKVSKDGVNVVNATEDQLIFNSNQNLFKVVSSGTATVSNPSGAWASSAIATTAITHGLTYKPALLVFIDPPATVAGGLTLGLTSAPSSIFFGVTGEQLYASYLVTNTEIQFFVTNITTLTAGWPVYTWTFKYYILQETAA